MGKFCYKVFKSHFHNIFFSMLAGKEKTIFSNISSSLTEIEIIRKIDTPGYFYLEHIPVEGSSVQGTQ